MRPYLDLRRRHAARKKALAKRRLVMPVVDGVFRYGRPGYPYPLILRYPYKAPAEWQRYVVPLRLTAEEYAALHTWFFLDPSKSKVDFQIFLEKFYLP